MSTNISRRKVVAGAAWATPVVAASAVVPAFASSTECEWESTPKFSISGTDTGAKTVQKFVVPAKVSLPRSTRLALSLREAPVVLSIQSLAVLRRRFPALLQ